MMARQPGQRGQQGVDAQLGALIQQRVGGMAGMGRLGRCFGQTQAGRGGPRCALATVEEGVFALCHRSTRSCALAVQPP
jgi:hypothetical protein